MQESVKLISYTKDALELLLYTKNTRLEGGETINNIKAWPMEKKLEHLEYMRNTIKSSWEMVDFIFEIKGVDKNFTHQLVRTRTGSYAQQAQRVVDAREYPYSHLVPEEDYDEAIQHCQQVYGDLIDKGYQVQDCRGVLPGSIHTEIIAKFNLRTLHDTGLVRLCKRAEGSYQRVFALMKQAVVDVYPWAEDFIKVACAWNGVCIFPLYEACPVKCWTIKATQYQLDRIQKTWSETVHVANPKAKAGRTM